MFEQIHPFWLVAVTGVISLVPLLLALATAYVKVNVVLSVLKNAFGAQQVPSALVIMALSLSITLFIMSPVMLESAQLLRAMDTGPLMQSPTLVEFSRYSGVFEPWRKFMLKHSSDRELRFLTQLEVQMSPGNLESASKNTPAEPSWRVLLPAFVLSELKEAFTMGFVVLLPFLVVDLIIANILVGMGMMMVSPIMIALPVKLVLFVLSDGWLLLTKGLINSYQL